MKPIDRLNHQIQDLIKLKALAQPQGKLTAEKLRSLDSNSDGLLSKQELVQAGFQSARLRSELNKSYKAGSANPSLTLFEGAELEQRLHKLIGERGELVGKTEAALKVEGFTRLLFNHFDENRDGALDIGEVRSINLREFKRLAKDFGVEEAEANKILAQLQTLAAAKAAELADTRQLTPAHGSDPQLDARTVVLPASPDKDFASGMRYEGDPVDDAIEAAKKGKQLEAFKAEFLGLQHQSPPAQKLLQSLGRHGLLNQENLFYLLTLSKQESAATLSRVAGQLTDYLAADAKGDVISAREKPRYVQALLRDMAFPEDINQGEKGTCAATAIQIELARRNPVHYLEMALSLARNRPYPLLPTRAGEARTLHPNTTFRGDRSDDRSLSAKLVQNSFMDLGHQAGEDDSHYVRQGKAVYFDSRMSIDTAQGLDESQVLSQAAQKFPELKGVDPKTLARLGDGMSEREIEYVAQGFFGNIWNDLALQSSSKETLLKGLDIALGQGRKVTIASEDHAMTVLAKKRENGRDVYMVASWSGHYTMTPEALSQRLTNVFVDFEANPH